jgi:hypothetical protein
MSSVHSAVQVCVEVPELISQVRNVLFKNVERHLQPTFFKINVMLEPEKGVRVNLMRDVP